MPKRICFLGHGSLPGSRVNDPRRKTGEYPPARLLLPGGLDGPKTRPSFYASNRPYWTRLPSPKPQEADASRSKGADSLRVYDNEKITDRFSQVVCLIHFDSIRATGQNPHVEILPALCVRAAAGLALDRRACFHIGNDGL